MTRTMLNEHSLPKYFWAKAVNMTFYIMNKIPLIWDISKANVPK